MDQRLKEIDEAIAALSAAEARRAQLSAQVEDLHRQREERQARVEKTAGMFRKEQEDVDKLERGGLHALLLSLTGNKEERLDRERREALAAKCQYDQAVADLDYLERKLSDLIRQRDSLKHAPQELEALWREKAELVKDMGGVQGSRLMELDRELALLGHQQKEIQEALSAGKRAKDLLGQIQDDLDSARSWGTWDMLGGGLIATMAKHDRLDSAQSSIQEAQRALADFRTELADVGNLDLPNVQIGEFATFADYFFDGLFSDWYVQSSIKTAQEGVSEVRMKLAAALRTLDETEQSFAVRRAALEQERANLLAAC